MQFASTIAIILVNYNNNSDTIQCVQSIYSRDAAELPSIVVVDNASKVKSLEADLAFYPHVKILYSEKNVGFGKANNIGIEWLLQNSGCRFVFILNNDTILEKNTITELVQNFPADSDICMVAPKILTYEDRPKIWYGGGVFNFTKLSVDISHIGEPDQDIKNGNVEFASGCAMLFKLDYFKHNAAFDPEIFMYDEDVELCLRMNRMNQKIQFVGTSVVYHKCQGSQNAGIENNKKLNQLHPDSPGVKFYLSNTIPNRYYLLNKYFKGFKGLKIRTSLTAYWLLKAAQYLLHGKFQLVLFTLSKVITNQK